MKIVIIILCFLNIALASTKWSGLSVGETYRLGKELNLQTGSESKILLSKGSRVKLIESEDLDMIKVNFQRYQLENCENKNYKNLETELELINNKKSKKQTHSVGVNLSKGCILEVFVEKKDTSLESFLK